MATQRSYAQTTAQTRALGRHRLAHKLPYAKVGRADAPAALLGAGIGALVGYAALAALGTSAFPLADLTRLLWYLGLVMLGLRAVPRGCKMLLGKIRARLSSDLSTLPLPRTSSVIRPQAWSVRAGAGGLLRAKILYLAVARQKRRFKKIPTITLPWVRLGSKVRMGRKPLNSRMGKGVGSLFAVKRQYGPGVILLAWRRIGRMPPLSARDYLA